MDTTETEVNQLIDKVSITNLVTRYFAAVDDKRLDLAIVEATFTHDGRILRPHGLAMVGFNSIFESHTKSFARFKATHHVITDHIVEINEPVATLRANVTAMHLWADNDSNPSLNGKYFLARGVLSAKAIKVDDRWRLYELANRVIWREGEGMAEMLSFEKTLHQTSPSSGAS
jgi:hypothetical protein